MRYAACVRLVVPVSAGELLDRISILELKRARLPALAQGCVDEQLRAARVERDRHFAPSAPLASLTEALARANRELWDAEERLRACERSGDFGAEFISLARSVYLTNDRRAALKRRIDELVGSELHEQKSYALPEV